MPEPGGRGEAVVRTFSGGPFAQNMFLVACARTGKAILVDPGAATRQALAEAKRQGTEVERIVLTHSHLDHVDGVPLAKRETGVPVVMHREAEQMFRAAAVQAQMFGVHVEAMPEPDGWLEPGVPVHFGECELEVRYTPGHAPGHVTLVGEGFALVGDCVFRGSIGRTDLPGGDFQTLMRSIREQILTLPDETVLYSGHGPETTVGFERVANPFLAPNYGGSAFG
ncbi:MAG TPA: MBL fold metallo-hydrolase [Longimicrobiaceae bacterium]|nr:MBL fold metallo-hydrolase [Longimicrobiaceae bacterium]